MELQTYMKFPYTISAEACSDIVHHYFDNTDRKFRRAEVTNNSNAGTCLRLYYTTISLEHITENDDHSYLEIPLGNVLNLLSFAMRTINASNELIGNDIQA